MALTAADIKFFAAATNTDSADGGGARSAAVVQTGALHTLFPAVAAGDRINGRVRIRKLYPSLVNTDATPLLGASVAINELPGDAGTSVAMFAYGDASTTRAQALAAFKAGTRLLTSNQYDVLAVTSGSAVGTRGTTLADAVVGTPALLMKESAIPRETYVGAKRAYAPTASAFLRTVLINAGGTLTFDAPSPLTGNVYIAGSPTEVTGLRAYAPVTLRAATLTGSATVLASSVFVQVAGRSETVALGTSSIEGFGALTDDAATAAGATAAQYNMASTAGNKRAVAAGDAVTLYHETAMAAATLAPGTVSTGRTTLEQITVRGNDGLDIATFVRNGPVPAGVGCTADLDAGTLTITSVAGWSQPVTVLHRIAHRAAIDTAVGSTLNLTVPVTRDFAAGSVLTPHLPLSDIQARVSLMLTQQAWTRAWSDTVIGNAASAVYGGMPIVTNQGAESDRWAVVFSDATHFSVYSERIGLVGSGTTGANFLPINPNTSTPYFTLLAAAWATGISVGTTLRFNTEGACPPVWVVQSIAPSAVSAASTRAVIRVHGSV